VIQCTYDEEGADVSLASFWETMAFSDTPALAASSSCRACSGVSIRKRIPGSKLILSGTSWIEGVIPVAQLMADTAREWGVRPEDMVVEAAIGMRHADNCFIVGMIGKKKMSHAKAQSR